MILPLGLQTDLTLLMKIEHVSLPSMQPPNHTVIEKEPIPSLIQLDVDHAMNIHLGHRKRRVLGHP